MKRIVLPAVSSAVVLLALNAVAAGQAFGLAEISKESKACIECHKKENAAIYQQWGSSKHYRANVGCFECHGADEKDPDAFKHEGVWIATLVTPSTS